MQRFALQYLKEPPVEKCAGNSIEQQKTPKTEWKVKGFRWQTSWKIRGYRFRLSHEIWKLNDTNHSRSNHAKDHDWERCGNRKPSIVFNAQRVVTGNILLISSSWPSLIFTLSSFPKQNHLFKETDPEVHVVIKNISSLSYLQSSSLHVFCGKTCHTWDENWWMRVLKKETMKSRKRNV